MHLQGLENVGGVARVGLHLGADLLQDLRHLVHVLAIGDADLEHVIGEILGHVEDG